MVQRASWVHIVTVFLFVHLYSALATDDLLNAGSMVLERPELLPPLPPLVLPFSNTSGARVPCKAKGSPPPTITWRLSDGSVAGDVPGLRRVLSDGTLVFRPFPAESYRQDVHALRYRCAASNAAGTVVSGDITVRGVVLQPYEVYVYDVYVIKGNTAVFRCHVPALLMDYVQVTSWIMDDTLVINKTDLNSDTKDLKFLLTSSGELYVRNATMEDVKKTFKCKTLHLLTKKTKLSSSSGRLIVTDPRMSVLPRITDQRAEVGADDGDLVAFLRCVAEGHPAPQLRWSLKNPNGSSTPIVPNERYRVISEGLLIHHVTRADAGVYICVASNAIGSEKSETTLSVAVPLRAIISPNSFTADVGSSLSIKCDVTGFPPPSISWLKDGRPAATLEGVTITGPSVLFTLVKSVHRGMWQCFARNAITSAHSSFELKLGDAPPDLINAFEEQVLQVGSPLSLHCGAIGTPAPQITWTLDGHELTKNKHQIEDEGVILSWLNISHVRTEDGGVYTCKATNKAGSRFRTNRINVYGKLSARHVPPLSAISGQDIAVHCPVFGYPLDTITWEKGGALLPIDIQQEVLGNGTLLIHKVQRSTDAGQYSCTASNKVGDSVTATLELAVVVPPKITPFSFQEDLVREGTRARLQCAVSEGDTPLTLTWLKNGQLIRSGSGITIRELDEYSSILTIASVMPDHNGDYTCAVSNKVATVSHTATLAVNVPPRWLIVPGNTTVRLGSPLMLHCQSKGFPIPSIQWMRVDGNNPSGIKYKITSGSEYAILYNNSLEIYKTTPEHQGFYYCIADNGIGKGLSRVIYVKIQAPVFFEIKEQQEIVKIGSVATLRCEAHGDQPITFAWSHKNKMIPKKPNSRIVDQLVNNTDKETLTNELTIQGVVKDDAGDYVCKATNPYGQASTKFKMIVQESPDIPEVLVIKNLGDRSVELSWNIPFDGNSAITQYLLQYKKKQDSWQSRSTILELENPSTSTVVKGLQPATVYEFRVAAENTVGRSSYSNVVTVALGEEAPDGSPQDVEVEAIDPDALRVSWKPPKKSSWNGAIRGYYIGHRAMGTDMLHSFTMFEVPVEYTDPLIYQLSDLKRYTQYGIVVQAYNNGGRGPSSAEVIAMTSEGVPHAPPQEVRCSPLSAHSVYVVWQPPPHEATNGIIRGYKVFYKTTEEWYDGSVRSNVTDVPKFTMVQLDVNRNYSIQILAYTRVGDGVRSSPVYCKTHEDVPGPPDAIKALPSSADSVLVSWKAPSQPNGMITRYNVYYKLHGEGDEVDGTYTSYIKDIPLKNDDLRGISVHNLEPEFTHFEVKRLQRERSYAFWVTAISSIGEGPSSTIVIQSPATSFVAAKSASFDDVFHAPWKTDMLLPCRAVGIPPPERIWKRGARIVEDEKKIKIRFDGSLLIKNLDDLDSGNYTCRLKNAYGQDEVHYSLNVQVPPSTPILHILNKTPTSIALQWEIESSGGDPIRGFILTYKRDNSIGQWERKDIFCLDRMYTLENLSCGATYLIYLEAYNNIGVGPRCDTVTVTTDGEAFLIPPKDRLIREGATFITIHLDEWPITGCPVLYFTAEYQRPYGSWVTVAGHFKPAAKKIVITGLEPATRYHLRLTAHSVGDPNRAEYDFQTLMSGAGGMLVTVPPIHIKKEERITVDLWIFIPLMVLILVVLVAGIILCVFLVKRRSTQRSIPVVPPPWFSDVGTLGRSRPELGISVESFVHLQRNLANNTLGRQGTLRRFRDDPNPYASVQVSSYPPNPEMMMQLMDKRVHPPPLPPCPEAPPPGHEKKWITDEAMFDADRNNFSFHNWDQGYSSAGKSNYCDGENLYATTSRPAVHGPTNPPDTQQPMTNNPGVHAGIRDPTLNPRPRETVAGEHVWLLDDRYPRPQHKEDVY